MINTFNLEHPLETVVNSNPFYVKFIWAVILEGYSVALTNLFNLRITYADLLTTFFAKDYI